jgi:hypothetical protein
MALECALIEQFVCTKLLLKSLILRQRGDNWGFDHVIHFQNQGHWKTANQVALFDVLSCEYTPVAIGECFDLTTLHFNS